MLTRLKAFGAYDERSAVVFAVRVLKEDVDHRGQQGVEESEDRDGDEELGGGREISNQEEAFLALALTCGHVEVHLVQPATGESRESDAFNP